MLRAKKKKGGSLKGRSLNIPKGAEHGEPQSVWKGLLKDVKSKMNLFCYRRVRHIFQRGRSAAEVQKQTMLRLSWLMELCASLAHDAASST